MELNENISNSFTTAQNKYNASKELIGYLDSLVGESTAVHNSQMIRYPTKFSNFRKLVHQLSENLSFVEKSSIELNLPSITQIDRTYIEIKSKFE